MKDDLTEKPNEVDCAICVGVTTYINAKILLPKLLKASKKGSIIVITLRSDIIKSLNYE